MITLSCALDGTYELWEPEGGRRTIPAIDFVLGDEQNILRSGEILRAIFLPRAALARRFASRRFTLTREGRSTAFLVGTLDPASGEFLLTVTAATVRPVHARFPGLPGAEQLRAALRESIPEDLYFFDPNGRPDHRRHLTFLFAEEIRRELAGESMP
jgi:CO/xanthine dehydrogenase FAD-binding subunit